MAIDPKIKIPMGEPRVNEPRVNLRDFSGI